MFLSYLVWFGLVWLGLAWFGLVWWNARKAWRLRKVACTGSWKKALLLLFGKRNDAAPSVWLRHQEVFHQTPGFLSFQGLMMPQGYPPPPSTLITPSVFSNKASIIAAPQKTAPLCAVICLIWSQTLTGN